jgi:hypothetical protein
VGENPIFQLFGEFKFVGWCFGYMGLSTHKPSNYPIIL